MASPVKAAYGAECLVTGYGTKFYLQTEMPKMGPYAGGF